MAEAVDDQCGVLEIEQLLRHGTRAEVRAQLRAGRWQQPRHGIVVLHNGPIAVEQQLWIAVLSGAPGAVLAGATAATLGGLSGFESERIHVLVPSHARTFRHDDVVVRRSRHLGPLEVLASARPPRTRLPRSLLDMASERAVPDRRARALLLAGVQQRLTTVAQLRDALTRRGPCRRRALMIETFDDAAGGIASVPEREFSQLIRRHHFPEPSRQVLRRRRNGVYYLDGWWAGFQLGAEVQGVPHYTLAQWDADLDRHNDITADGSSVLHFSSYAVRHRSKRVGDVLERALRSRGWRG